jgi:NitT/TauT family transport system permease protein
MSMRADLITDIDPNDRLDIAARPVPLLQRLYANSALRRLLVVVVLGAAWQVYASWLNNPLLVPTLADTVQAFVESMASGVIPQKVMISLRILLTGYTLGIFCAAVLTGLAATSRMGNSLLETLTAMLNPLPAIALLPLALLWFGLGEGSLVFVLLHSVTWVVAMNTHSGFQSVSQTLRMVGRNYGLNPVSYVLRILVPAAFPSILAGLKIGWAFAWRTLVAAELVFGASSGKGGLGWYIFENKNELEIANVFAGLLTVIFIGLIVDSLVFRQIETRTLRRWGMQAH